MPALKKPLATAIASCTAAIAVTTGALVAGELCVSCTGPDASYRCTFKGNGSPSLVPGLQLTCISQIAKQGGHQSCTIERNRQKPCDSTAKIFAMPEAFAAPAEGDAKPVLPDAEPVVPQKKAEPVIVPPADHAADPSAAPEPEPAAGPTGEETPPRTVKEIVDKSAANTKDSAEKAGAAVDGAAKSAGSALEKAGTAVSNAAKKTWNCLTSLFGDC